MKNIIVIFLKAEEDINSGKLYSQNQVKEKIEELKKK
jgi:hypothetical protein